jgi:hypothetical protein
MHVFLDNTFLKVLSRNNNYTMKTPAINVEHCLIKSVLVILSVNISVKVKVLKELAWTNNYMMNIPAINVGLHPRCGHTHICWSKIGH